MSSSTILEDELDEKHLSTPRPDLVRTQSNVEKAIDAEANINISPAAEDATVLDADNDDPGPPPNGGFRAWLQVVGSFFLFFNCWGTVNAFGVFQTYYETNPLWHETPSNISWIGSIQAFLLLLVGLISGPAYDNGYFRSLIVVGAILIPFGFMMTSLATAYWQTMLAQAFCIGIGNGCIFVPSVAILPQYFSTRKALANGLAASGSSFGGLIYPIVFRRMQQEVGFAWATRTLGFLSFATVWFSVFVMRPRIMPKQRRPLTDLAAFKELPYTLFCLSMVFGFIGLYGPLYYIGPYAIQEGITGEDLGFYLLPIINAASVFGRIIPNTIADMIGPLNVLFPCATIAAILALAWIGIKSLGGIIAFALIYGFFSGGFVSLPPVAIVTLTSDMSKIGTRMGQCFFLSAFGLLVGTPVSGAILKNTGSWVGVQLWSGAAIMVTGMLLLWARVAVVGWNPMRRA
ncbi:monocarboxylate permease like proteinue, mch4 [Cladophialophora carrionii]|uniref:Monocarboxylate permease like proteinue, mch4 n=1 Tax=Cladophialophora carrionii TaxID=86049 RepID=A0A1C1CUF4_9EURO|nr:monocarboxylate permease like proteinue, mch4 [Cladophialophora carrionii]